MPITTVNDVAAYTGATYTDEQEARLTSPLIGLAERWVKRAAGRVFYDATDVMSDPSQDWLYVVSLVADRMVRDEDPAVRAAMSGPFQSENFNGEYSYTLRQGVTDIGTGADTTVEAIISQYRMFTAIGIALSGPTRIATPIIDTDVSRGLYGT